MKKHRHHTDSGIGQGIATNPYKEICDQIHTIIHSLRLIPNYKASEAEKKIGKYIVAKYASSCKECKEVQDKWNANPQGTPSKSFYNKLTEALDND